MFSKMIKTLMIVFGLALSLPTGANAQSFSGFGCSGNTFLFCAEWMGARTSPTSFILSVKNISTNTSSAFTKIGLGNLILPNPSYLITSDGWQLQPDFIGFNGFQLSVNHFGSTTTNGINWAILAGQTRNFEFVFDSSVFATDARFNSNFSNAQIAIHDQGGPNNCGSSKGTMTLDGTNISELSVSPECMTVVPEPMTIILMGSGLLGIGIVGVVRNKLS